MQIVNETDERIVIEPGEVVMAHNTYSFNSDSFRVGIDERYKKYEDTSEVTTPIERHIEERYDEND
ncbi:MAG: hypothetical protein ABEH81_01385 [Halopenitus sp.]